MYFEAFWLLNSCRSIGFSIGFIPWTAIRLYVSEQNLDKDIQCLMIKIIMAFDLEYVKQENAKIEKGSRTPPPSGRPNVRTSYKR